MRSLLSELSRRNVFRVAAAYVVVAWVVLQVGTMLFATFEAPNWVAKVFVALIFLGFPIALIISWAFELTAEGIKKTTAAEVDGGKAPTTDLVLVGLLVVVVGSYIVSDLRGSDPVNTDRTQSTPLTHERAIEASEDGRVTIAVLPFANMSSDTEQQYFSDGITEEILNALAGIDGLKVTSRTSSFSFKSSPDDLPTVASKLGVAHILEGSVRRSGDMLRITAQLIRAADDTHLWSQTYDRDLKDIFKIQEEISAAIAAALKVRLVKEDEDTRDIDPGTYDLYLRALGNIARGSFTDMNLAVERLERVIKTEPGFARGHSGLARAISFSVFTGAKVGDVWIDRMEAASNQALALDRQAKEAYATLGNAAYLRGDLRWAVDNYAHAEELNALGMYDHFSYAASLVDLGRIEDAERMAMAASMDEPLNHTVYYGLWIAKAAAGKRDAALSALATAREIEPDNPNALYFSILTLASQGGEIGRAKFLAEQAYGIDAIDPEIKTLHALNHLSLGEYDDAEKWVEAALATDPDVGFALGVKGLILAAQGKTEAARVLALRALDRETGAHNFRFGGDNMLVRLAFPDAIPDANGAPWSERTRAEYQRHWPKLFRFSETGDIWSATNGAIVSPATLASVDYIAHLKAAGEGRKADRLAAWLNDNVTPTQFSNIYNNPLFFAELAIVEGDELRALEIIEREVAGGFVMCWQWRLRDNPYFASLKKTPRFAAALAGVAKNVERQKAKYVELKAHGDHSG